MKIQTVLKRDGSTQIFDRKQIENAVFAAARAVGTDLGRSWAEMISYSVVGLLGQRCEEKSISQPSVEQIQDIVEEVLVKSDQFQIAKAYILYRQQRQETSVRGTDHAGWREADGRLPAGHGLAGVGEQQPELFAPGLEFLPGFLHRLPILAEQDLSARSAGCPHQRGPPPARSRSVVGLLLRVGLSRPVSAGILRRPRPRWRAPLRSTCKQRSGSWSISSILCRASSPGRLRSPISIPCWRRSCITISWDIPRSSRPSRSSCST